MPNACKTTGSILLTPQTKQICTHALSWPRPRLWVYSRTITSLRLVVVIWTTMHTDRQLLTRYAISWATKKLSCCKETVRLLRIGQFWPNVTGSRYFADIMYTLQHGLQWIIHCRHVVTFLFHDCDKLRVPSVAAKRIGVGKMLSTCSEYELYSYRVGHVGGHCCCSLYAY